MKWSSPAVIYRRQQISKFTDSAKLFDNSTQKNRNRGKNKKSVTKML